MNEIIGLLLTIAIPGFLAYQYNLVTKQNEQIKEAILMIQDVLLKTIDEMSEYADKQNKLIDVSNDLVREANERNRESVSSTSTKH